MLETEHVLDDADLDLVAALQIDARAPLNTVAEILGTSASTAARRIQRLQQLGLLRFISTVHWSLITTGNPYVVWIKCLPGSTPDVARAIRKVPQAETLITTTGDSDIYCTLYPLPGTDRRRLLSRTLAEIPGIASIRSDLILRPAREAFTWRLDRLTAQQTEALRRDVHRSPDTTTGTLEPLSEIEFRALQLLVADSRVSAAEVARELEISRSTAYRTIQSLLESGAARPRLEIEPAALGLPVTALFTLDVQPQHIPAALSALGKHPNGRFTVMTAGPAPILHHGVFTDEEHLSRFVTDDLGALPGLSGLNTLVALSVLRRQWIDRDDDLVLRERAHDVLAPELHPR